MLFVVLSQAMSSAPATAEKTASHNVWLERQEFYNSALPRDSQEEEQMLQAALEMSKLEQRESSVLKNMSLVLSFLCRWF